MLFRQKCKQFWLTWFIKTCHFFGGLGVGIEVGLLGGEDPGWFIPFSILNSKDGGTLRKRGKSEEKAT